MTTGEQGRTPPDAEHYLDLSDVPEEDAGPRFDVALRGYDRRQVDEHVAGLRRMVSQLRAQLAVRERRHADGPGSPEPPREPATEPASPVGVPAARQASFSESAAPADAADSAPTAEMAEHGDQDRGDGDGRPGGDMVGAFNDRLRGILQAAEQEAQLVRSRAAESLLAEHAESRAALADLRAQRDAVFDELMRVKGRLDDLVSNSGRPPAQQLGPGRGPWPIAPGGRPPRPMGPPPPFGGPGPRQAMAPPPLAQEDDADTSETPQVDADGPYADVGRPDGDARS